MPHVEQSVVCKRSNSEIIADYASTIMYEGGPNPVWICDEMCLYVMKIAFCLLSFSTVIDDCAFVNFHGQDAKISCQLFLLLASTVILHPIFHLPATFSVMSLSLVSYIY